MNKLCHKYEHVMCLTFNARVTSKKWHEWVTARIRMSHVTHTNEKSLFRSVMMWLNRIFASAKYIIRVWMIYFAGVSEWRVWMIVYHSDKHLCFCKDLIKSLQKQSMWLSLNFAEAKWLQSTSFWHATHTNTSCVAHLMRASLPKKRRVMHHTRTTTHEP